MFPDHETIRNFALGEIARRAEQIRKQRAALTDKTHAQIKKDLPAWTKSIEAVLQTKESYVHFYITYQPGFFRGGAYKWTGRYAKIAPDIVIDLVLKLDLGMYAEELTKVLGKPLQIHYNSGDGTDSYFSISIG